VKLLPARFVSRPNRFIVRAELSSGAFCEAHLADPGRLVELLVPGARLRLDPVPGGSKRLTRFTLALVRSPSESRAWVSVQTQRANRLAEDLLRKGAIRGSGTGFTLRREVPHGNSRFDFLLEKGPARRWVEVKSVTLVEEGRGLFPDAPTARGQRHVDELAALARRGEEAMVLFIVQRGDADSVSAHPAIDPAFAASLAAARAAGVRLRAAGFRFDAAGRATYLGPLPVRNPRTAPSG
jgi:sugar fermentation stimulation protein A